MVKILKNCEVYAPERTGRRDIVIAGDRIAAACESAGLWEQLPGAEIYDFSGKTVCPGLVDMHVHVSGGGGEQGPSSRTPESTLTAFTLNGVTTLVGLTGTDCVSRSMENLLFKCRALEEEGISTLMLTGGYRYPSPTITGSVMDDIALIDKVIGVKIALSDHRGSQISSHELGRLASEARVGGMLGGKAGIVVLHMGLGKNLMKKIFEVIENGEVPPLNFLPTHCCRTPELIADAVKLTNTGGRADFTADLLQSEKGTAEAVMRALDKGADPSRITMSSDAFGSQPRFDEQGRCTGLETTSCATLLQELRRFTRIFGMPLEDVLPFFTSNAAQAVGLGESKGKIAAGYDADILVLDEELRVDTLFAKGRLAVREGKAVLKGRFE